MTLNYLVVERVDQEPTGIHKANQSSSRLCISDQTIEEMHKVIDRRFSNSNFFIKYIESKKRVENLLKGIFHVNARKDF